MGADVLRGFTSPPSGERSAQRKKRRLQQRNRQRDGFACKGWNPALQFGGDIPGGQRQPRQPSAFDSLDQIRHETEKFVLKRYRRLKFGPKIKESRPAIGGGQIAGHASGATQRARAQRDVRHGSSMV
jgi:hypothetical protein